MRNNISKGMDFMMTGKTGNGKSTTDHSITNLSSFSDSSSTKSVASDVRWELMGHIDCSIKVADTPGTVDTEATKKNIERLITPKNVNKMVKETGIDLCLVLIIPLDRNTGEDFEECLETIKKLNAITGKKFLGKHCVILVTYGDACGDILKEYNYRCALCNNNCDRYEYERPQSVQIFFSRIEEMTPDGCFHTHQNFRKVTAFEKRIIKKTMKHMSKERKKKKMNKETETTQQNEADLVNVMDKKNQEAMKLSDEYESPQVTSTSGNDICSSATKDAAKNPSLVHVQKQQIERPEILPLNNSTQLKSKSEYPNSHDKVGLQSLEAAAKPAAHGGARPKTTLSRIPRPTLKKESKKTPQCQQDIATGLTYEGDLMNQCKELELSVDNLSLSHSKLSDDIFHQQSHARHGRFGSRRHRENVTLPTNNYDLQECEMESMTLQCDAISPDEKDFPPTLESNDNKMITELGYLEANSEATCTNGDVYEYDKYLSILQSVDIDEFHNSATEKAMQSIYGEDDLFHQNPNLIPLATKLLKVKLGHSPGSTELVDVIEDSDFNEKSIVTAFIDFCKTPRGADVFKLLVETSVEKENPTPAWNETIHTESLEKGREEQSKESSRHFFEKCKESHATELYDSVPLEYQCLTSQSETDTPSMLQKATTHSNQENSWKTEVTFTSKQELLKEENVTEQTKIRQSPLLRTLKKENEFLNNSLKCIQCTTRPTEITTLPCGHFILCHECSNSSNRCPLCGRVILAQVQTFLS